MPGEGRKTGNEVETSQGTTSVGRGTRGRTERMRRKITKQQPSRKSLDSLGKNLEGVVPEGKWGRTGMN